MKKLFLSLVFIMTISLGFSNSLTTVVVEFTDCHAQACEEVGAWEEVTEISEGMAEQIYQAAFAECEGN